MIDLIQLQDDLYGILMSAPQLATVNIVEERKFLINSAIAIDAIWQTIRNGCQGNGLLIEIPDIISDSDNVTGPPQQVELSFVSFQNGDAAFIPPTQIQNGGQTQTIYGGGLYAEQIEQYLIDLLHLLNIGGIGTMRVVGRFSTPARDYANINARRTKILMTPKQTAQTPRCSLPIITVSAGLATITCATAGAAIYYTVDGSFPSNPLVAIAPVTIGNQTAGQQINANSFPYTAPFSVNPGQRIRAAAYLPGYNLSPISRQQT